MPGKTHGDKIDDLSKLAAALSERVDNLRRDFDTLAEQLANAVERISVLETQGALLAQQLGHLEETRKESSHRVWMVVAPVAGALVGAALTALITHLLRNP